MKRNLSFFLSISFFLLIQLSVNGQPWLRELKNPDISIEGIDDFKRIKKAFNQYWEGKTIPRGKGYKPFSRWEWMMEQRISDGQGQSIALWNAYMEKSKSEVIDGNWVLLGPDTPATDLSNGNIVGIGRIDCIAFHPQDPSTFYVGSPTGGLWKTTDKGASWTPLTDNIPSMGIADIAIHPQNPDIIYIATGDRDSQEIYSAGVLKSTNGGLTWSTTALSFTQNQEYVVNRLLIRPDNPDTLIAATTDGIFFITNGGEAADKVQDGHFKDLEFKPDNPDIVYAANYSYGYASVYKSSDGGLSFQESFGSIEIKDIRRIELAVSPDEPDWVYALCTDKTNSAFHGLYRSYNSGETWSEYAKTSLNILGTNPDGSDEDGQGWYDLALAISPSTATEVYVGGINIWKAKSFSDSWTLKSFGYPEWGSSNAPYVHVDQHILKFHPLTGDLYSGNDGGISKTMDQGNSWIDLSEGLEILQVYRIGLSATQSDLYLAGSQDNSSMKVNGSDFKVILGGDGMECIIDYSDTSILYASSQRGKINISRDGGINFKNIVPTEEKGAWVTPYVMHPEDPNILYAGYKELYLSNNQGDSWANLSNGITSGKLITAITLAPSAPDYIYMATSNLIWETSDNGESWKIIKSNLPSGVITYIAVSQYDPKKIWVSLSNYSSSKERNKVFTSNNGGLNWENYSTGLPDVPVNCVIYENDSKSGLYAGTDLGVYYRNREMDRWINFSNQLPNVIVNELEIFYPERKIRAATYGRGIWESDLFSPATPLLYAEFSTNKYDACIDGNFQIISHSSSTDSLNWLFDNNANPIYSPSKDTLTINFSETGEKNISLIAYLNGESDTLARTGFLSVDTTMNLSVYSLAGDYFWRGDTTTLIATSGDNFVWSPETGLENTTSAEVRAYPDSSITYYVIATEGQCVSIDSIKIDVYANNLIKYALALSFGENGPFINYAATVEQNEPHPPLEDCNSQTDWCDEFGTGMDVLGNSVWFSFEAPPAGIISLDSRGFDNQIAIYDSPDTDSILAGNYTILAANDDYNGSNLNFSAAITNLENLIPGKTYYVQVDGSGGNLEGEFYLYLYNNPLDIPQQKAISNSHFIVYPNPNNGSFSISINSSKTSEASLQIYNLQGKIIYKQALYLSGTKQEIKLSLDNKIMGIYLIRISSKNWTEIKKIIIE
ncbi:MAG: T9SS type A sorting domain-containing protein [Bacteroidales bacterium]|nr:T9SS type A sorting domain-containing protein [Bacteroidales bacterium]